MLQLLDRVGPAGARRVMAAIGVAAPGDPMTRFLEQAIAVPAPARAELDALRETVRRPRRRARRPPRRSSASGGSSSRCSAAATTSPSRGCATSSSSSSSPTGFETRERFVTDLTLDPPVSTSDLAGPPHLDEDYLVLSTIHSAKGGEWDVVHVIHAADGMIPSDMATGDPEQIEEERRLFYVALTRARDTLRVTFPLRYHRSQPRLRGPALVRAAHAVPARGGPRPVLARAPPTPTRARDAAVAVGANGSPGAVDALLAGLWSE